MHNLPGAGWGGEETGTALSAPACGGRHCRRWAPCAAGHRACASPKPVPPGSPHSLLILTQKQTLMQHILRCDYEACRQYLVNLEQAVVLEQNLQVLQTFLSHRCDGNRNILHACVSVCFPTSNKETKEEEGEGRSLRRL